MKEMLHTIKKRWKWFVAAVFACTLLLIGAQAVRRSDTIQAATGDEGYDFVDASGNTTPAGGELLMRRQTEIYTVKPRGTSTTTDTYEWKSLLPEVVRLRDSSSNAIADTVSGSQAKLEALTTGTANIQVTITHTDDAGKKTTEVVNLKVNVVFSIHEGFIENGNVKMEYLFPTAYPSGKSERKSLIMEYDSVVSVGAPGESDIYLKLVFGDGTKATWSSANKDIIMIETDSTGRIRIKAVGAGRTQLSVSWTEPDSNLSYSDTIDVYVRPQLTTQDGTVIPNNGTYEVHNKDLIKVSIQENYMPAVAAGDKLVWAIVKGEGDDKKLVRDSLGNRGDDASEANLVYLKEQKGYRIEAKAGIYDVLFFVKGSYTKFEEYKNDSWQCNCASANVHLKVSSEYSNKDVTISLGGTYSLPDAFNISTAMFNNTNFTVEIATGAGIYVSMDDKTKVISTISLGTAVVRVKANDGVDIDEIPGIPNKDWVYVTIVVSNTFNLNISKTHLAVGAKLELSGIIGDDQDAEASQFTWTVSDEDKASLSNTNSQYVTVTALKETALNTPVIVTLSWTDAEQVTWVAYCEITIDKVATNFSISPEKKTMEVNDTDYLSTNLQGEKNILWVSSDPSIVSVEAQPGNVAAKITSYAKVGEVVITAINRDNDAYATAVVTVTSAITQLTIEQGTSFTTTLAEAFVFFKVTYAPSNATATDLIWDSSDKTIATIDEHGTATLLKEGQTTITVKPEHNPNGVFTQCVLTIREDPITNIKTDVTTLEMIQGETYQVQTTITPENPSDKTLTWSSTNTAIANVDVNGKITANSVGTTTVMVTGGKAQPVLIQVTVRYKITSIAFEKTRIELAAKETTKLNVIFTPNPTDDKYMNKELVFNSADTTVATVDNQGNVTAIAEGITVITCYSKDMGKDSLIQCIVTVTKEVIPATGFEVTPEAETIQVGSTLQIECKFTPENVSDKTVEYKSMDENIASVDETGLITGVSTGVTIIQCTAVQSGLTDTCTITVEPGVTLTLEPPERDLAIGHSFTIKAVTDPKTADKTAMWESSNTDIATVSKEGKVTGVGFGDCVIKCTLVKYNVTADCVVTVSKLKTTLKLNKSSIRLNVGQSYRLKKTVTSNASSIPKVKFTSKNKKIASVGSTSGKIKAKKVGSTYIVAKTQDVLGKTAKCRVIVIRRVTKLSLNKTYATCYVGRTLKLKATVKPKNASIKKLSWESSNTTAATVLDTGKVTGIAEGDAYITARTTDGSNKSARCYVKILEAVPITSVVVAQSELTMKKGDKATLSYTVLPSENSDDIKMASDNTRVAKVTNAGKVTAVGTGTATITITATSGVTATVTVNVVALNKTSLKIRQYDSETLIVSGTDDTITWYSANNRIATVVNGKVVGRGIGTTYVYAYVNGCKMGCKVEVTSVGSR